MSDPRRHAHHLIDCLPETQLSALVGLLETIVDPHPARHDQIADEQITEDERRAVAEADEWLKHNQPIPHEEVLAEFGLTMADWEKMADEPLPEELLQRAG